MKTLLTTLKKSLIMFMVVAQVAGYSALSFSHDALASEIPAPGSEASISYAPCSSVNGVSSPTGVASHTYTFNPSTCKWENRYYIWDPVTKVYSPTYDQTRVLNASGTAWEYPEWYYSTAEGNYRQRTISIPIPAEVAQPSASSPGSSSGSPGTLGNSNNPNQLSGASSPQSQTRGTNSVSSTGPYSGNAIENNNNTNAGLNFSNNTAVFSTIDSSAVSGDAMVLQNTNGGSASTGNADVIANVLNMIQSAWDPTNGDIATFNAGLYGSFNGDLLFNPDAILKNTGPSSDNSVANNNNQDLKVNVSENARIQNDIDLDAISGDATVSENTQAGDATTGDASATANVINLINSRIASGGSFIGTLNIHGDLTGDIILPPSILAQLRNTGQNSNNNIANNQNTNIDADINKNSTITNNLDLNATSGNAISSQNTQAGDATTGDANTNVKQANIIGQNKTGTKGLLVFVNVLGSWVGMLWDGSGTSSIDGTGADSNNSITNNRSTNIDANIDQNYEIVNNINLNAESGDATVTKNTEAGNARSGNASSSANLLNVIDSDIEFSDWFGVLFINVFGKWQGNFGANTTGGSGGGTPPSNKPSNKPPVSSLGNGGQQAQSPNAQSGNNVASRAASVVGNLRTAVGGGTATPTDPGTTSSTSTEASSQTKPSTQAVGTVASANTSTDNPFVWVATIIVISGALIVLNGSRIIGVGRAFMGDK